MSVSAGSGLSWTGQGWLHTLGLLALGAITVFGFAPFHLWGLTLLGLAGLFIRLHGVSQWAREGRAGAEQASAGRAGFRTGLVFGLGWFSASCFWIASAFVERGPTFVALAPPMVGGLAVLLALFWAAAGWWTARVMADGRSSWRAAVSFIAVMMLAELARGHILSGFPWNLPGYAFEPGGAISQGARLVGIYGLSMLMLIGAVGLARILLQRDWVAGAGAAALFLMAFGYGALRLGAAVTGNQPGIALRIVTVPFRQSEQLDPRTRGAITQAFIDQSLQPGLEDITHLIWPESAVLGVVMEDYDLLYGMGGALAQYDDTPPVWIINSVREEISPDPKTGQPDWRYYNASVAISYDAAGVPTVAAFNDKRKLVPFGEFIPGGEIVEDLGARLVSTALNSFTPADAKSPANYPGLPPISAQICYEVIFPGLTRRGGAQDPQAILNQSNDAWFGRTIGLDHHAAIARYRAIEEGLPLIRAAANGVTGSFDAYGRVVDLAPQPRGEAQPTFIDTVLPLPAGGKAGSDRSGPSRILLVNCGLALLNLVLLLMSVTKRRIG